MVYKSCHLEGNFVLKKLLNKNTIVGVFLVLFVFQALIERLIPFFSYFDEFVAMAAILYAMCRLISSRKFTVKKPYLVMSLCVFVYFLLASVSTLIYHYQNLFHSLAGAFLSLKWFFLMIGGYYIYPLIKGLSEKSLKNTVFLVTVVLFVWTIHTKFLSAVIPLLVEVTMWDLCAKCLLLIAITLALFEKSRIEYAVIILNCVMLALSGKAKGFGALALIALVSFWTMFKGKKFKLYQLFAAAFVVIAAGWQKIHFYFIEGKRLQYARYMLYETSVKIANDYFPLGTGWSTFGSHYAAERYSPVYFIYGLGFHRELGYYNHMFLNDSYWPIVIAESGWLGFAAVLGFCIVLYFCIDRLFSNSKKFYAAGIVVLGYMMITSLEETGFQQPVLSGLGVMMGLLLAAGSNE